MEITGSYVISEGGQELLIIGDYNDSFSLGVLKVDAESKPDFTPVYLVKKKG